MPWYPTWGSIDCIEGPLLEGYFFCGIGLTEMYASEATVLASN